MIENDAVVTAPTLEGVGRAAERWGVGPDQAARRMLEARERVLSLARRDPLRFGYEPDVWLVGRAMLGLERIPEVLRLRLAERTGRSGADVWPWWSERLRERMGLERPVSELLVLGANRSGKTDFAAKVCHEIGLERKRKVVIGSQKLEKSVEVQQGRMWRYLPEEWRRNAMTQREYIKYSEKNGFTGNAFITAHETKFGFVFYTQKLADVFEGEEGHLYWMDEEVGLDWIETIRFRTASVKGRLLVTFTPISGYTPAVGDYQEGMRVVRWCHGYMLPRDGGEPAPWAAAGLSREEAETLAREGLSKLPQTVPSARAEDCVSWATGPWEEIGENAVPGRVWERVPRAAVCADPARGILWFHGRDNPYGNPLEVIAKASANKNARDVIRTRVYGIATKQAGKRFAAFDRKVHVLSER